MGETTSVLTILRKGLIPGSLRFLPGFERVFTYSYAEGMGEKNFQDISIVANTRQLTFQSIMREPETRGSSPSFFITFFRSSIVLVFRNDFKVAC